MGERSIVEYFGLQEGNHCGYCGTDAPDKFSHGMWAHYMTVRDYQDLIDRGWRRSGKYVYKPVMDKTCCPQYAIRCEAEAFRPTKSHKKILKRLNAYLQTGKVPKTSEQNPKSETKDQNKCDATQGDSSTTTLLKNDRKGNMSDGPPRDRSNKAKEKRKKRKIEKMVKRGELTAEEAVNFKFPKRFSKAKDLEDYLDEQCKPGAAHTLTFRLLPVEAPLFETTLKDSAEVFKAYQMAVHKDEPSDCGLKEFTGFLVDTPLIAEESEEEEHPGYGSFHEQYILDGKIIAVGVLDILPRCISSKYFYYDPSFHFLSLGTFSALREIWLTRKLHKSAPSLEYYYMGFYVHNCPKMRYKAQYSASYLLCPETYSWIPTDSATKKLASTKYARFSSDLDEIDKDLLQTPDPVLVLHNRQAMPFEIYRVLRKVKENSDEYKSVKEYASLVGKTSASRILLYRE